MKEYPKMLYKTREDNVIVANQVEELEQMENGYDSFEINVLGRKPEGIDELVLNEPDGQVLSEKDKFEKETGKKAVWKGKETKPFMKWLKGN